jgi:hypothetical protein
MHVHKGTPQDLRSGIPFWLLGFLKWGDDWTAFGLNCSQKLMYRSVWCRDGKQPYITLPLKVQSEGIAEVVMLYPNQLPKCVETTESLCLALSCLQHLLLDFYGFSANK